MNTRDMTTDDGIHTHISELVAREKELRAQLQAHQIEPEDERAELQQLEVQLDQCWDLLRQRRARRAAGQGENDAHIRAERVVEGYQQ